MRQLSLDDWKSVKAARINSRSDEVRFVEECNAVEQDFATKVDTLLTACKQLQLMHSARNRGARARRRRALLPPTPRELPALCDAPAAAHVAAAM